MDDNFIFFESEEAIGYSHDTELSEQKKAQLSLYKKLTVDNTNFDFIEWMKEFNDFFLKYDRFLYSHISSVILREKSEDKISFLMGNIKTIVERIQKDLYKNYDYAISDKDLQQQIITVSQSNYKLLIKLYDHCNLANTQRTVYNQTKQDISNLTDDTIKQKVGEYEKDITTQLISLVSIFTALSFVIFGGISVLDNLLQNIRELVIIKTILISDLWLICMSNLFILFTRLICFLTDKGKDFMWKTILIIFNLIFLVILGIVLFCGYKIYGQSFFH